MMLMLKTHDFGMIFVRLTRRTYNLKDKNNVDNITTRRT